MGATLTAIGLIYFIWNPTDQTVIVGWTTDLKRRLAKHQRPIAARLVVLQVVNGVSKQREHWLHRKLAARGHCIAECGNDVYSFGGSRMVTEHKVRELADLVGREQQWDDEREQQTFRFGEVA